MYKRVFTVILPENQSREKVHLYLPSCQASNVVCYSALPVNHYLMQANSSNTDLLYLRNLNEYKFDKAFEQSSFTFVKFLQDKLVKDFIRNANIIIFGDKPEARQSLISNKISKNSLMKELINTIFKLSDRITISFESLNEEYQTKCSLSKIKLSAYSEYLKLYTNFQVTSLQSPEPTSFRIILEYTVDGTCCSTQIVNLNHQMENNMSDLALVLSANQEHPIIKKIGGHIKNVMYCYCPELNNKLSHRVLDAMNKEFNYYNNINHIHNTRHHYQLTEQSDSTCKTLTDNSKVSNSQFKKKKSTFKTQNQKSDKYEKPERGCSKSKTTQKTQTQKKLQNLKESNKNLIYNAKQQILTEIQQNIDLKIQSKNSVVELVIQQKNKVINKLELLLQQKEQLIEMLQNQKADQSHKFQVLQNQVLTLQSQINCLSIENTRMTERIEKKDQEIEQQKRIRNQYQIKLEHSHKSVQGYEAKICRYQVQIEKMQNDIQQSLARLTKSNKIKSQQILKLRSELTNSKENEKTLIIKLQKFVMEQDAKYKQKLRILLEDQENKLKSRADQIYQESHRSLKQLEAQILYINSQLEDSKSEISKYSQKNQDLIQQISLLRGQKQTVVMQHRQLLNKIENLAHLKGSESVVLTGLLQNS